MNSWLIFIFICVEWTINLEHIIIKTLIIWYFDKFCNLFSNFSNLNLLFAMKKRRILFFSAALFGYRIVKVKEPVKVIRSHSIYPYQFKLFSLSSSISKDYQLSLPKVIAKVLNIHKPSKSSISIVETALKRSNKFFQYFKISASKNYTSP